MMGNRAGQQQPSESTVAAVISIAEQIPAGDMQHLGALVH
jgi:hypothetical protein